MKRFIILFTAAAMGFYGYTPSPQTPCCKEICREIRLSDRDYTYVTRFIGLALQPYANNLDYGVQATAFNYGDVVDSAVSPDWKIPDISPRFHFGFDLEIARIFHDASSILSLNWERFHSNNDSNSFTVDSSSFMFGPFFEIGPDASDYKMGKGSVSFHFDEVNLDYGTFIRLGNLVDLQIFTGVSFSRLVENRFTKFSDFAGTTVRTIKVPSKFIGAGPQLGFDLKYMIVKGFQFVGNTRATLFVGTFNNKTTFSTSSSDLALIGQDPNVQTTSTYRKRGVVPGFEGRLGLAYETSFSCNYMLKIEAGYQAQIYINAIRSTDMGSEVALAAIGSIGSQTTGVYARTFERVESDFSLAGPYGKIDFGF